MLEFAASYPREAEESLGALQSKYISIFGLLDSDRQTARALTAEMGIIAEPYKNGYNYEITVPAELKALAKKRANQLLSRFDCIDLNWFGYLASTEFSTFFDHENQKGYDFPSDTAPDPRLSTQTSTASGKITGFSIYGELAKAFDCFLRVRRFL